MNGIGVNAGFWKVFGIQPLLGRTFTEAEDDLLDKAVAQPRLNMLILVSFAAIALPLACVGIYGVVSYFATQRTQENRRTNGSGGITRPDLPASGHSHRPYALR